LKPSLKSLIRTIVLTLLGCYLCLIWGLHFFQDALIFPIRKTDPAILKTITHKFGTFEHRFTTQDGTQLQYWSLNSETQKPLLFYFDGNAVDVAERVEALSELQNFHVVVVNYRGYGQSQGEPSQAAIYSDIVALYDFITKKEQAPLEGPFVIGRSLGSVVATYLASQRPVQALVLVTPPDGVQQIASGLYPYMPISLILKHPFNSIANLNHLKIPALIFLAESDQTVPHAHSRNFINHYSGPLQEVLLPGTSHSDIMEHPEIFPRLVGFLKSL
jgi:pimeloyl-ACP methyl ester carboxylesterase